MYFVIVANNFFLVKPLLSRNFFQKNVRVNFRYFHTTVWKNEKYFVKSTLSNFVSKAVTFTKFLPKMCAHFASQSEFYTHQKKKKKSWKQNTMQSGIKCVNLTEFLLKKWWEEVRPHSVEKYTKTLSRQKKFRQTTQQKYVNLLLQIDDFLHLGVISELFTLNEFWRLLSILGFLVKNHFLN